MAERVARWGLGLAALGRPAYITSGRDRDLAGARSVEAMRSRTAEVLDAAYAHGVRYVDVARSYGRAEEFLAAWLADREPDDVEVASKWGYRYVGDWRLDAAVHEVKDHSRAAFAEQLAQSRDLLGERLAVYQVHSLTPDSPVLGDRALLRALGSLRDSGVRVGFSTSGPAQADVVRAATEVVVDGEPLFTVVQSTWNLLETSAGPALAEAADRGVEVVVKEALANGRLTDEQAEEQVEDAVTTALRSAAREAALGLDQLALAVAAGQPWASRVLLGAATPDHVARAVAAAVTVTVPSLADLGLGEASSGSSEAYWQARSRRLWA